MSHKEVSMKELRVKLTELTRDLDDADTLVLTSHGIPMATLQKVPSNRRDDYRKLLDAEGKITNKPTRKTRTSENS